MEPICDHSPLSTSLYRRGNSSVIPQDSALILTKIIATLGPASIDASTVTHLIDHGARVFRINFSHGSFPQFAHMVNLVRRVQKATGAANVPVGLLGDLCGPKIRLGPVCDDGLDLHVGDEIRFQKQRIVAGTTAPGNIAAFSTTHPALIDEVCPGDRLLIDLEITICQTPLLVGQGGM